MSTSDDLSGISELAASAIAPIEQELRHRLLVEVGEQDLLAIESALLKAFINGMRSGNAGAAETVVEQTGAFNMLSGGGMASPPQFDRPLPELDPWAERHAGGR
jgi:hypothetical protein